MTPPSTDTLDRPIDAAPAPAFAPAEKPVFAADNPLRARALRLVGRFAAGLVGLWLVALVMGAFGLGHVPGIQLPQIVGGDGAQKSAGAKLEHAKRSPAAPATAAAATAGGPGGRIAGGGPSAARRLASTPSRSGAGTSTGGGAGGGGTRGGAGSNGTGGGGSNGTAGGTGAQTPASASTPAAGTTHGNGNAPAAAPRPRRARAALSTARRPADAASLT
jgi:hypothetical protein